MRSSPKKIIRRCGDPHAIYARILPFMDVREHRIARRGLMTFTSDYRLVRYLVMILGHLKIAKQIYRHRKERIFVSEGSLSVFAFIVLPVIIMFRVKHVIFNVNHNFNNALERFNARWMARWVAIGFIEPSEVFLRRYPFVTPVRIIPDSSASQPICRAYVFLGQRAEQFETGAEAFADAIDAGVGRQMDVARVGGSQGRRLSDEEFCMAFSPGSAIILLYNMENYSERHSGIVLEAIANGVVVFLRRSELGAHYRSCAFRVHEFDSCDEVVNILAGAAGEATLRICDDRSTGFERGLVGG